MSKSRHAGPSADAAELEKLIHDLGKCDELKNSVEFRLVVTSIYLKALLHKFISCFQNLKISSMLKKLKKKNRG